jgi:tetratricopeptide (TPR) repeat protein
MLVAAVLIAVSVQSAASQPVEDPALRTAVERFFAIQEAEDIQGYLALWSRTVTPPRIESLKFIFDTGDDKFSDIRIVRATPSGDRMRARVAARRQRTMTSPTGSSGTVRTSEMLVSLTFLREGDGWKLLREGPAHDDLAAALVEAGSKEERDNLLAAEPDMLTPLLASALARIASAAAIQQAYARAQSVYEIMVDVAQRVGDARSEGEALQNLGNALYFQRKLPDALTAYSRRLAIERTRGNDEGMASALVGIATIRYSFAEYSEALARYREALAIQEVLADEPAMSTTLISTGNVRYLQGDYPAAIADYRRSRDLNRKALNTDGEARALEGLGRVYNAQGDYAAALEAFAGVLAEGKARTDRARQGTATLSMGDVHFRLGNLDAARASYGESRGHFEAVRDMAHVGRVWQSLALAALAAGKLETAEEEYQRSITICTGNSDGECTAGAQAGLAFTQTAREKYPEAIAWYQKAIASFSGLNRKEEAARAEIGLSQAFFEDGQLPEALAAAGRARHAAVGQGNDDVLWRALTAEARALRRSGKREQALGVARAAVRVIEEMQSAALERPASSVSQDAAAGLATFAILQAESGDAGGAFETSERMRALELRASIATNERDIARGMTDREREAERVAAAELFPLQAQLAREKALPKPDRTRIASLEQRITQAAARRNAGLQTLFERLPDLKAWRGLAAPPSIEETAALLVPGTVLIALVVDENDVLALVASDAQTEGKAPAVAVSAHIAPLKRRALGENVAALISPASLGDVVAWRKPAAAVRAMLPQAALDTLAGATHVIVLPHDTLWRVPFDALLLDGKQIAAETSLSYAGSAAALLRARTAPAGRRGSWLAIGAPELPAALRDTLARTAPTWTIRPAEHGEREEKAIAAALYPKATTTAQPPVAQVLTGAAATETAFRAHAPAASALHVAAPFRINAASPLFSPILLAQAPRPADATSGTVTAADDGVLESREIMNLELTADVALLSDGASLSMRNGASASDTVQWAWMAAGVPALVLARWTPVPASADALLADFHRRVRDGAAPAEALRAAREALRANPDTSAPIHWAGWMVLGR